MKRLKSKKNKDRELRQDLKESIGRLRAKRIMMKSEDHIDRELDKLGKKVLKSKIKSLDELEALPKKKKKRKPNQPVVLIRNFILRGSKRGNVHKRRKRRKKFIFVFGSNLAGRHGKGSAKKARLKYGAEYGVGKGRTGNAYAIPTKDHNLQTLSLRKISKYINKFFHYAYEHQELRFRVVKIGCGLAGYSEKQVKPLFKYFRYLPNVKLPKGWKG